MILLERNEDLSIKYWLDDQFADAPFVTIVDGFPVENLVIPSVSVDAGTINPIPWELGNPEMNEFRLWYIDIFAVNKSQRDDFSYRILHALYSGIPVYDYNAGFPPTVTPQKIGMLEPTNIKVTPVRIMPELVEKLYYRANITFTADYSTF